MTCIVGMIDNGKVYEKVNFGNSELLVGFDGKLFGIYTDFTYFETKNGDDSIGIGQEFALGAIDTCLYLEQDCDLTVKEIVEIAIKASKNHCPSVGGEIIIKSVGKRKIK